MDIVQVADRYGILAAILVVFGVFIWKVLMPQIEKQNDWTRRQVENANNKMQEQTDKFLGELKRRDELLAEQTKEMVKGFAGLRQRK